MGDGFEQHDLVDTALTFNPVLRQNKKGYQKVHEINYRTYRFSDPASGNTYFCCYAYGTVTMWF